MLKGSRGKERSTTMEFVGLLRKLVKDKRVGKYVVPIVPDESRTFGMEGMFSEIGIYSAVGQLYEPVDRGSGLMYYKEAKNGQILEEGINEAGSMSSFIAAGTSYCQHGINMIPFFIYYSMFGFQRIGDLVWAASDMRAKGFMLGGTAGRTTLNGECDRLPHRSFLRSRVGLRSNRDHLRRASSHVRGRRDGDLLPDTGQREL
jgi:pyruvate dehydrogenase E1 component